MQMCGRALSVTRSLLAALALLLLSGCVPGFFGTPVPRPETSGTNRATAPVATPPQAAKPPPRPRAAQQGPVPQPAGAPAPVTEARLATPPADRPGVIGHSEDETESLLGKPLRVTEEASAKVWRYQSDDCSVDVRFFFDVSRGRFFALDVTPITGDMNRCLAKLEDHVAS